MNEYVAEQPTGPEQEFLRCVQEGVGTLMWQGQAGGLRCFTGTSSRANRSETTLPASARRASEEAPAAFDQTRPC
eukprot:4056366-Prorocentrum_lima.AAC.1